MNFNILVNALLALEESGVSVRRFETIKDLELRDMITSSGRRLHREKTSALSQLRCEVIMECCDDAAYAIKMIDKFFEHIAINQIEEPIAVIQYLQARCPADIRVLHLTGLTTAISLLEKEASRQQATEAPSDHWLWTGLHEGKDIHSPSLEQNKENPQASYLPHETVRIGLRGLANKLVSGQLDGADKLCDEIVGAVSAMQTHLANVMNTGSVSGANKLPAEWVSTMQQFEKAEAGSLTKPQSFGVPLGHISKELSQMSAVKAGMVPPLSALLFTLVKAVKEQLELDGWVKAKPQAPTIPSVGLTATAKPAIKPAAKPAAKKPVEAKPVVIKEKRPARKAAPKPRAVPLTPQEPAKK